MRTALIQGSGGVGSALAQTVIDSRMYDQVILAARGQWQLQDVDGVTRSVPLDLTSDESIDRAAKTVMSRGDHSGAPNRSIAWDCPREEAL
jgi:NADP-dependent 3-hydroxy acid dehydrogenase YdfG